MNMLHRVPEAGRAEILAEAGAAVGDEVADAVPRAGAYLFGGEALPVARA